MACGRHLYRSPSSCPSRLKNRAPPRHFSLAVERFEMTHAPILTSFTRDFSGQKWTLRKSSGGQNGWGHTSDANSEFTRKLWRAKKFRAVSSVVERLVYTDFLGFCDSLGLVWTDRDQWPRRINRRALNSRGVWTFLDRSRPNFQRRGGKTGGPPGHRISPNSTPILNPPDAEEALVLSRAPTAPDEAKSPNEIDTRSCFCFHANPTGSVLLRRECGESCRGHPDIRSA